MLHESKFKNIFSQVVAQADPRRFCSATFVSEIPPDVRESVELNDYAVVTRYPNWGRGATEEEFHRTVKLARIVVDDVDVLFRQTASA